MKTEVKKDLQPEQKYKLKQLTINIQYREPLDLKQALFKIVEEMENGNNIVEKKILSANVGAYLEFIEKSDYEEKQINGVWCQVFKSKI